MNEHRVQNACVENADDIQDVYHSLGKLEQELHLVSTPEELEALEREIRSHTDKLGLEKK